MENTQTVPDVCSLVRYQGEAWRVDGWLRKAQPRVPKNDLEAAAQRLVNEVLESIPSHSQKTQRYEWCLRSEATHLGLYSICGCIAPVEECVVEGTLEGIWQRGVIESYRNSAVELGEEHEILL